MTSTRKPRLRTRRWQTSIAKQDSISPTISGASYLRFTQDYILINEAAFHTIRSYVNVANAHASLVFLFRALDCFGSPRILRSWAFNWGLSTSVYPSHWMIRLLVSPHYTCFACTYLHSTMHPCSIVVIGSPITNYRNCSPIHYTYANHLNVPTNHGFTQCANRHS